MTTETVDLAPEGMITHPDQQTALPEELVAEWVPRDSELVFEHACKDHHGYHYNSVMAYMVGGKVVINNFIWMAFGNYWVVSSEQPTGSLKKVLQRLHTLIS